MTSELKRYLAASTFVLLFLLKGLVLVLPTFYANLLQQETELVVADENEETKSQGEETAKEIKAVYAQPSSPVPIGLIGDAATKRKLFVYYQFKLPTIFLSITTPPPDGLMAA